jgi:hypothetical protein
MPLLVVRLLGHCEHFLVLLALNLIYSVLVKGTSTWQFGMRLGSSFSNQSQLKIIGGAKRHLLLKKNK